MKRLVIIVFCLFSIFFIQSIHVYANDCVSKEDGKVIDPKVVKKCEGLTDGTEPDIFDHLIWTNTFLFFITCILFVFGINLSKKKKNQQKKKGCLLIFFVGHHLSLFSFSTLLKHSRI